MKNIYQIYPLLFFTISTATLHAQTVTFAESEWQERTDKSCSDCGTCADGSSSEITVSEKSFAFYCDGLLTGRWYLVEKYVVACDSFFFEFYSAADPNTKDRKFNSDDMALRQIYTEVQENCPLKKGIYNVHAEVDRPSDYRQHIEQYFSDKMSVFQEEEIVDEEDLDEPLTLYYCREISDFDMRKQCSDSLLFNSVYTKVNYPFEARKAGVDGTVQVSFTVDLEGFMNDEKIEKDIGSGCGRSVHTDVSKLAQEGLRWNVGVKDGEKVITRKTLDVIFRLGRPE
ncbi:MAG: energy transducer TonB [Bacteroidota bacterium]